MKKFIAALITFIVVFLSWLLPAAMADTVDVYEDNQLIKSVVFKIGVSKYVVDGQTPGVQMDVAPFIQDDRTFVPVRFLGNALGVTDDNITWDSSTQTATIKGNATLQMSIGQARVISNGQARAIDVAPVLTSDRTFLPARYVAEGLGYEVAWDAATQTVVCWPAGQTKPDVSAAVDWLNGQAESVVGYKDVNGFKIPENTEMEVSPSVVSEDVIFYIRLYKPIEKQYQDLTTTLTSKFDSKVVDEVVAYAKQKTERNQELQLKKWPVNGYTIEVVSDAGNYGIPVLARKN